MRTNYLSDDSLAALQRLVGKTIHTLFAPSLDAAGGHLAAPALSMLMSKDEFTTFACHWTETPEFLNDSWLITVAEDRVTLNIATDSSGALLEPCTISMYDTKPIERINVFTYSNCNEDEGPEETVQYDRAIVFSCGSHSKFCIGCTLNGPAIAEYMHFSEDPEVIKTLIGDSILRLSLD